MDADPAAKGNLKGRDFSPFDPQSSLRQVHPVVRPGNSESPDQVRRAPAEPADVLNPAPLAHEIDSLERLQGPEQNSFPFPSRPVTTLKHSWTP